MLKMVIKFITISPLPVCDTYFGNRAQKVSTQLVVIEAVPIYDSASFTEVVAICTSMRVVIVLLGVPPFFWALRG